MGDFFNHSYLLGYYSYLFPLFFFFFALYVFISFGCSELYPYDNLINISKAIC